MADEESNLVDQSEIEALLGGGDAGQPAAAPPTPPTENASGTPPDVAEDPNVMSQNHIDALLGQPQDELPTAGSGGSGSGGSAVGPVDEESGLLQRDIEFLLDKAEAALESVESGPGTGPPTSVAHFRLQDFAGSPASTENATLDLISDVDLDLRIELGRTHMYLEDVLRIRKGSVVPLDKLAGDPVDIYVNGRLIARGEVLVLNENFCVRVTELIAGTQAG